MNLSYIHNRRNPTLMVFMTVITLLFVQSFALHGHDSDDHHGQIEQINVLDNHEHHAEIHAVFSNVNDEDHGISTEMDLSAETLIKNLKFNNTLTAVLTFFVILFVPLLINTHRWSISLASPFTTRGIAFRPPLRAPPH